MNTKICSNCGWEFPAHWPGRRCKFCRSFLRNGFCIRCGEWAEKLYRAQYCAKCRTEMHRNWCTGRRNTAKERFDNWLGRIEVLPTPHKTLTEEQWLEACMYFNGCAYCGCDEIASRSMFLPFRLGGKYCAWNIIPACERCELMRKDITNPFLRFDDVLYKGQQRKDDGLTLENLQFIVDYLGRKMEVVDE